MLKYTKILKQRRVSQKKKIYASNGTALLIWAPTCACVPETLNHQHLHPWTSLLTPTYEHACKICGISRFGYKIVHSILGAERSVELSRDGGKRTICRFVCRTATHVQLSYTAETRRLCPRPSWIGRGRWGLGAFDLELTRRPMILSLCQHPSREEGQGSVGRDKTRGDENDDLRTRSAVGRT